MKKQILLFSFIIIFVTVRAQVNLQDGSLQYSVPIFAFSDNSNNLNLNLSFLYSSGQGLKVDNIPSNIGQGWELNGIGSITRIQKGLPDDQYPNEGAWNNLNNPKYPPGYLYNPRAISEGCPNSLTTYPIFQQANLGYLNFNEQDADRELDEFVYNFNGHTGKFILDKQNLGDVVLINNSRIKITASFSVNGINYCRTTLYKFTIVDETGISYEFSALGKSRTTRNISAPGGGTYLGTYIQTEEVPLTQNPYVVNSWGLTKITNLKSGKFIQLDYVENQIVRNGKNDVQTSFAANYDDFGATNCTNFCYVIVAGNQVPRKTTIRKLLVSELKPELSKITFSDNSYIDFYYGVQRFDCTGSFKLDNIVLANSLGERIFKFQLTQKYFIKNIVDNANEQNKKWARLCLTEIAKLGKTDTEKTPPLKFEYNTGTNSNEDFVPPIYFDAQDPWGYYNGSLSGVSTNDFLGINDYVSFQKLVTYNSPYLNAEYLGGADGFGNITTNAKANYAKNGLLKKVFNSYGGVTEFEYEQNTISNLHNKRDILSVTSLLAPSGFMETVVGGVHLSKIINNEGSTQQTTEYIYRDDLGNSTLWGIEQPKNMVQFLQFYSPQGQYPDPLCLCCKYHYKYLGNLNAIKHGAPFRDNFLMQVAAGIGKYSQILAPLWWSDDGNTDGAAVAKIDRWRLEIAQTVINIIETCSDPSETHAMRARSNRAQNLSNSLPLIFAQVTTKQYSNLIPNSGKSVFTFTTEDDYSLIIPTNNFPFTNKVRYYPWKYGLLKSEKQLDANNNLVHEVINKYNPVDFNSTSANTQSCNCIVNYTESKKIEDWTDQGFVNSFTNADIPNKMKVEYYNTISGRMELESATENTYKGIGNVMVAKTDYLYNNLNYSPRSTKYTNSKGYIIENKVFYPEDYNLALNPILQDMKDDNIVAIPVSSETWQTKGTAIPELLSTSVTEFGLAPNGDYKPIINYGLQTDGPVSHSIIGSFDPDILVRNPVGQQLIVPISELKYNGTGNAVQISDITGKKSNTTLYYYNHQLPVATVSNATYNEVAYTSFEKGFGTPIPDVNCGYVFESKWEASNNVIFSVDDASSPTGKSCAQLNTGGAISVGDCNFLGIVKDYKLSFWASSSTFSVTAPTLPIPFSIAGPTINGWTYYEFDLPAGTSKLYISGNNCKIDELRLYPKNATMSTMTYNPSVGKTSECDINNRITYYEYDGLGRIAKVLDEKRNIIKTYEYNFKN